MSLLKINRKHDFANIDDINTFIEKLKSIDCIINGSEDNKSENFTDDEKLREFLLVSGKITSELFDLINKQNSNSIFPLRKRQLQNELSGFIFSYNK